MRPSVSDLKSALGGLADRLHRLSPLSESEHRAMRGLWRDLHQVSARQRLPKEGEIGFVVSGWACERRTGSSGRRQIISFLTPGDAHRTRRDPKAEATETVCLTHVQFVDASAVMHGAEAAREHPGLALALAIAERRTQDFLVNHIVRLTSRDARSGLAHLMLELEARADPHTGGEGWFALPIGQRPLGHAMGFSTVHVNKTLTKLREAGLLEVAGGCARVLDREGLQALAAG